MIRGTTGLIAHIDEVTPTVLVAGAGGRWYCTNWPI